MHGLLASIGAHPRLVLAVVFGVACTLAGWLWDRFGASTTFLAGAALVVVPLLLCRYAPRQAASRTGWKRCSG